MKILDEEGRLSFAAVSDYAKAHSDVDAATVAATLVRPLTKDQLATYARGYIADLVEAFRRDAARAVERAAEIRSPATPPARASNGRSPRPAYRGSDIPYMKSMDRRAHRKALVRSGEFDEWYESNHALIAATGDAEALEFFEADWHEGGWNAYFAEKRADAVREHIHALLKAEADAVRLETTEELLSTMFALGDGERVTWGEASIEQHEQRIALLVGNAAGNVETAARHEVAARMIREAGVTCLAEVDNPLRTE